MQVKTVVLGETINGTRYSTLSITQCNKLIIYFTVFEFILKLVSYSVGQKKFPGCVIDEDSFCLQNSAP